MTASGWFAGPAFRYGELYKIYAESFKDQAIWDAMVSEAQRIVNNALETG